MLNPFVKRKIAVHMGSPKSGTTWLQTMLHHNRANLKQIGVDLLLRREAIDFLTKFQERLSKGGDLTKPVRHLSARADEQCDLLISEEGLAGNLGLNDPSATVMYGEAGLWAKALLDGFPGADFRFFIAVRSYADVFDSGYIQLLKMGRNLSPEAFTKPLNAFELSWAPMVERLLEAIKPASLVVFDYDKTINERLCSALEGYLGPLNLEPPQSEITNRRYSNDSIRIAQLGNAILDREGQRKLRKLLETHVVNDPHYTFSLFTKAQRQQLSERYEADISRIMAMAGERLIVSSARRAVNKCDSACLF